MTAMAMPLRRVWLATAVASLTAVSAHGQTLGRGERVGPSVWEILLALGFCLGLAVLAIVVVAKLRSGRMDFANTLEALKSAGGEERPSTQHLHVKRSIRVTRNCEAAHIKLGDREWLVVSGPGGLEVERIDEAL